MPYRKLKEQEMNGGYNITGKNLKIHAQTYGSKDPLPCTSKDDS